MTDLPPPPPPLDKASPWPFVGMIGVACVGFLIGAGALLTPAYVVVTLSLLWIATLGLAIRWWTPHPRRLPWLPLGLAVVWFIAVLATAGPA